MNCLKCPEREIPIVKSPVHEVAPHFQRHWREKLLFYFAIEEYVSLNKYADKASQCPAQIRALSRSISEQITPSRVCEMPY